MYLKAFEDGSESSATETGKDWETGSHLCGLLGLDGEDGERSPA